MIAGRRGGGAIQVILDLGKVMLFTMNRNTCAACTPAVCCALRLRLVNIIMWIKCCRSQPGIIIIHVSSTENAKRPVIINDAFSKSHHVVNRQ